MKRAIVIRSAGDSDIAKAIVDGMTVIESSADEMEAIKAELQALRKHEAELAVRLVRDRGYWRDKLDYADWMYGYNPEYGAVSAAWWGMIGLVCETVNRCYVRLRAWNRG